MNKKDSLFYFIAFCVGLVLVNLILKHYYFRIDLTEEKRFTLSDASKKVLRNLEQPVYVEVFLDGDLPPGFVKLRRSILEMLEECKQYSGNNLQFKSTNPTLATNEQNRNRYYYELAQKGIQPTNIFLKEGENKVEKLIFPGALVSTGSREAGIVLLKGATGASPDEAINQSIENLEYEIVNAIKELGLLKKKKIGILTGNLELDSIQTLDLISELNTLYEAKRINIRQTPNLQEWDAVIIAKPQRPFSEDEKLKLDQYVVNGGKLLAFLDGVKINLDSIGENGSVTMPLELNLDDLFFKWGVRLNKVLVQDLNCGPIPVNVGNMGDQPQIKLMPWPYYPLFNTYAKHSLVRNIDAVYSKFTSTLDSVAAKGIKKTPLVFTSKYSKTIAPPSIVNLNEMRKQPDVENYNKPNLAVAYLLEGKFKSLYANRPLYAEKYSGLISENSTSKIIVFADGDVPASDIDPRNGQIITMGQNLFLKKKFANKDFILNSLSYLTDDDGFVLVRNKELTIRPLDKFKIKEEKVKWQFLNVFLPLLILSIFGFSWNYFRDKSNKSVR
ncbi:MAG: gliding motility-associated ABC transporter substrate-binding protein GldG [Cytophagales bacterium]